MTTPIENIFFHCETCFELAVWQPLPAWDKKLMFQFLQKSFTFISFSSNHKGLKNFKNLNVLYVFVLKNTRTLVLDYAKQDGSMFQKRKQIFTKYTKLTFFWVEELDSGPLLVVLVPVVVVVDAAVFLFVLLLFPLWLDVLALPPLLLFEWLVVHAVDGCVGGVLRILGGCGVTGVDCKTRRINSCFSLQSWNEIFFFWRKSHKSLILIFWRYSLCTWGAFKARHIKQFVTVVSTDGIPSLKQSLQKSLLQLVQFFWKRRFMAVSHLLFCLIFFYMVIKVHETCKLMKPDFNETADNDLSCTSNNWQSHTFSHSLRSKIVSVYTNWATLFFEHYLDIAVNPWTFSSLRSSQCLLFHFPSEISSPLPPTPK